MNEALGSNSLKGGHSTRGRVVVLPTGERVELDDDGYGMVTCPDCKKKRRFIFSALGPKTLQKISERRCSPCSVVRLNRVLTGIVLHESGAKFFLDRDRRDSEQPNYKTAFLCANYGRNPNCLGESYTHIYNLHKPKWGGLCQACVRAVPGRGRLANRVDDDVAVYGWSGDGGTNGPLIANVLFSQAEENGQRVPVTYAFCPHHQLLSRQSVRVRLSAHKKRRNHWPLRCRTCFDNPAACAESLAAKPQQADSDSGDRQKNRKTEKRRRGPEKGRYATITEDAFRGVFKELGGHATQEEVAECLKVTDRAIRDWQKHNGFTWRQVQKQFS